MYNHDDEVIIFTGPIWDRRIVDKCCMKPHSVVCSVDKINLVLYYCGDYSGGSKLLQHWVSFPNILKENNKQRAFTEATMRKDKKYICKVK